METCPHCKQQLNPQHHFLRGSMLDVPKSLLTLEWPSAVRARKFMVRCPHCSNTYLSLTLRRFGFITYGSYVYVVGLACIAAVALVLLVSPRS
ncbi:MAG: hypothetical protein WBI20_11335 [Burkholderiaceae bacterium]